MRLVHDSKGSAPAVIDPTLIKAIVEGRQPQSLTPQALVNRITIPHAWADPSSALDL